MIILPPENKGDGKTHQPVGGFPSGMTWSRFNGTAWEVYFDGDAPAPVAPLTATEKAVVAAGGQKEDAPYYKEITNDAGMTVKTAEIFDPKPSDSISIPVPEAPVINEPVDEGEVDEPNP